MINFIKLIVYLFINFLYIFTFGYTNMTFPVEINTRLINYLLINEKYIWTKYHAVCKEWHSIIEQVVNDRLTNFIKSESREMIIELKEFSYIRKKFPNITPSTVKDTITALKYNSFTNNIETIVDNILPRLFPEINKDTLMNFLIGKNQKLTELQEKILKRESMRSDIVMIKQESHVVKEYKNVSKFIKQELEHCSETDLKILKKFLDKKIMYKWINMWVRPELLEFILEQSKVDIYKTLYEK